MAACKMPLMSGKRPITGRIDCEISAGYELNVKVDEHATAGKTIIARKKGGVGGSTA